MANRSIMGDQNENDFSSDSEDVNMREGETQKENLHMRNGDFNRTLQVINDDTQLLSENTDDEEVQTELFVIANTFILI